MNKNYPPKHYPHSNFTQQIIALAIKVHKALGPGFKEKFYQRALYLELRHSKLAFEREKKVTIIYNKSQLGYHIIDFDIENKVILELKSTKSLTDVDVGQLTTYLKPTNRPLGLLLNFGQPTLEIKRVKL
jgi:GxxExxY protein